MTSLSITDTKKWLNRGFKLDNEINQLEEAKRAMFDRITSITPSYEGEVVNGTKDPHKYDLYAQYCADIDQRIDELYEIKCEIHEVINQVEDVKLRTLLTARYINFRTFEQIAVDMAYDWRHIMRIHKEALNVVYTILNMS